MYDGKPFSASQSYSKRLEEVKGNPSTMELHARILEALSFPYFQPQGTRAPAIPAHYVLGACPLVVIVGPNAGGKSFFRRVLAQLYREERVEFMPVSMELRTERGIIRAFVFGDEHEQATGEISAHSVLSGIRTCQLRTTPHAIFWDEPDLGLAEGYCRGMGRTMAAFVGALPKHTEAVYVITHSKPLLQELVALQPHYLHLGSDTPPPTLSQWLGAEAPVLEIEGLRAASHARMHRITALLPSR